MKKFAVIGNPVSHSLSPLIHHQFAGQFDLDLEYKTLQAEPLEFDKKINDFKSNEGSGLNVTVPYKKNAFTISDRLSSSAILAKAVNTLSFEDDQIVGDNTDGAGLVNDLQINKQIRLKNKRILILGAGGAVSGVIGPLLEQKPEQLLIANRTASKALELESRFCTYGPIKGCGLNDIDQIKFDLVINGTAASLSGQVPQVAAGIMDNVEFAYDMMYADRPTAFLDWALKKGVTKMADGLGMLVEQAAVSFYIWHAKQPDTNAVLTNLRKSL